MPKGMGNGKGEMGKGFSLFPIPYPLSPFPFPLSHFPYPLSPFPFPLSPFPFPNPAPVVVAGSMIATDAIVMIAMPTRSPAVAS